MSDQFTNEVENLYPIPERYPACRSLDLLRAAGLGRIGVDQRLIAALLQREDILEAIAIYRAEATEEEDLFPVPLDELCVDILRHHKAPQALDTYLDIMRANEGRATEAMGEAFLEIGQPAIEPLLKLAAELDESQMTEVSRILAALRPRDERVFPILKDHFEYDTFSGALCFALHGDPQALPLLKARSTEAGIDDELRGDLARCIEELETPGEEIPPPPFKIFDAYDKVSPPEVEVLSDDERLALLSTDGCAEYQNAVLDDISPEEMSDGPLAKRVREMLSDDKLDSGVRGRAWDCLSQQLPEDKALAKRAKTVFTDASLSWPERAGALGAYAASMDADESVRAGIRELYSKDEYRAAALKAMWRSFDRTWVDYFPKHIDDKDQDVREQAIFGIGHFGIVSSLDKLEKLFGHEDLRAASLYAYALATPGGADRAKAKAAVRLIERLAGGLDEEERELVEYAIDQRLMQLGKQPVFQKQQHQH